MRLKLPDDAAIYTHDVDLARLVKSLDFTDEMTAEAARIQPKLFLLASINRVQKMRRRQKLEAKLKLVRSQCAKKIRQHMTEVGERATDKMIEERLTRNKEVAELSAKVDFATTQEEFAKMLQESYRQRGSSLKIVAELVGAEVYVSRRMEGAGDSELDRIRKKLGEKYPGQTIREMRRRRNDD